MKIGEKDGEKVFKHVPAISDEEAQAFDMYITLQDKHLISDKTLLEKFGFDFEEEFKQLERERNKK